MSDGSVILVEIPPGTLSRSRRAVCLKGVADLGGGRTVPPSGRMAPFMSANGGFSGSRLGSHLSATGRMIIPGAH
ncbi:MAG: hypothetical protein CM15mP21_0680 [Hyphomicrobiales bacterium]|nr:MAG: hypothetical protein CM15mP21_0680 [Hyphomicrobiales bacterium]